jgi:hypothetical protein
MLAKAHIAFSVDNRLTFDEFSDIISALLQLSSELYIAATNLPLIKSFSSGADSYKQ